jgi:branched-chain amino acid aminotransferase
MHMAATCLHYGQEAFEGLKAFMGKDGKIRVFRSNANAKRMYDTAEGIRMAPVPAEIFKKAILTAVKLNSRFVPPYGLGASLYIRPLLIGSGPEVGVKPSKEYLFMVFVTPVGPYFKEGFKPVDIMVCRGFDRAAPLGTGCYKVGGNYAASLNSLELAHHEGYSTTLYLDPKEKKYIDEAGPANFFGIRDNTYITPKSKSILPSITNMSLQQLCEDMGLKVERRPVPFDELSSFEEVGACGTAAVITPIRKIVDPDTNKIYEYCLDGKPGPVSTRLYNKLVSIQNGDEPDTHAWVEFVD